ncbi:MAG: NADH-quinone oxidoreductase subunit A [Actinobacteria bacterium]|nr:NADH-quinone oxidoreductase subunit A [Actinomycetota bacterium]
MPDSGVFEYLAAGLRGAVSRTNALPNCAFCVLVFGLSATLSYPRGSPRSCSHIATSGAVPAVPRDYFSQYITIGIFVLVGLGLVGVTLQLARLVRPNVPTREKYTTYESGIDPIGRGWTQTNVRYYIFALLFVIFDVEAVFLFPWAIVFERLGTQAFIEMLIFIAILAFALLYAIRKKMLEWL